MQDHGRVSYRGKKQRKQTCKTFFSIIVEIEPNNIHYIEVALIHWDQLKFAFLYDKTPI